MKHYWDLTEKERAALTSEDVERFVDYELMARGVLRATPPRLEPEPAVAQIQKRTVYRIKYQERRWGAKDTLPIAFHTREIAAAFLALDPLRVEFNYHDGVSAEGVLSLAEAEIVPDDVAEQSAIVALTPELSKAGSIKKANAKAREDYERAVREQTDALKEMWEDWSRCRELGWAHEDVARRLEEYVRTAGDETVGSRFLHKVFTAEKIRDACAWVGRDYPDPNPPQDYDAHERAAQ